jgi:hypothetical protein
LPHVADNPEQHLGKHVGESQHCVSLVKHAAGLGATPTWRRGKRVLGGDVPSGTCIATFTADGRYANATDGSSHAAVLLEETPRGSLRVLDQWVGHPVAERVIRDNQGVGPAADDASRYYVVEVA